MKKNLRNILIFAALIVGASSCDPARAAQPVQLETYVSLPGEDADAFVERLVPYLRAHTTQHGAEVCGNLQMAGGLFRLVLTTSGSVWSCDIEPRNDGEWKASTFTVHTHTEGGGHAFSPTDVKLKLRGYVVTSHYLVKRDGNRESAKRIR